MNDLARKLDSLLRADPAALGALLAKSDETGHTALCRLVDRIRHYGPSGTFALADQARTEDGGCLCIYGVSCGKPSRDYMERTRLEHEAMAHVMRMFQATGVIETMVWENPRFSSANLCNCGHSTDNAFAAHDPLCRYRVEHSIPVSIEEYRAALPRA